MFRIKELPTSVFAFVCMWLCAFSPRFTDIIPRLLELHSVLRAECRRTSRQLRSVSPNIISYNAAIASCEEVSMVSLSHRCVDVRCSEWDGFCWRMGFYNNERLIVCYWGIHFRVGWTPLDASGCVLQLKKSSRLRRITTKHDPFLAPKVLHEPISTPLMNIMCLHIHPLVLLVTFPFNYRWSDFH